jgi:undecaprenyl-diphosphatase
VQRRQGQEEERRAEEAGVADGLLVGLGQALALGPGVSRSGAAFAAARARGFGPLDADRLSWRAGLPVIAGATLLQAGRLRRRGAPSGARVAMAVGAAGAFGSTLVCVRVLGPRRRVVAMGSACLYRVALACLVFRRASLAASPGQVRQRT